jgi:ATP-dependent DNA ligase
MTASGIAVLCRLTSSQIAIEGVIAKDGASRYVAGRSDRWLKIKTAAGAERESKRRR